MTAAVEPVAYIVSLGDEAPELRVPIGGPSFTIGRDPANQLCVSGDPTVSRQHCMIHVVGPTLTLEDLKSRNGTYLNGRRVNEPVEIPIPATLMVGRTRFAVVPGRTEQDDDDVTSAIETTYASDGSIIVPPSVFLKVRTDAFLVVDVVDSTSLVRRDDATFTKMMLTMGRMLERSMQEETEPFLKSTGDGFFACFGSAEAAFNAGLALAPGLRQRFPIDVHLSVALHWGMAHLNEQGDRIGKNVHAVFSLEQLRHAERLLANEMTSEQAPPVLVLMTEAFWVELVDEQKRESELLGSYPLKGMEEGTRIFRWMGSTP